MLPSTHTAQHSKNMRAEQCRQLPATAIAKPEAGGDAIEARVRDEVDGGPWRP